MALDSASKPDPRHPIESIASDYAESVRGGQRGTIDKVVESNPQHESELRELLPVIQQLEKARQSHIQRPAGLATLGASRPDHLGDFELVRQIGRGGMGVVFEAVQRSLGRKVALKVLPTSLLADGDQLRRFQREARTAASLHHTNIVPVFGVGEDQGFHYFVMQRIDGRGLDRVLSDPDTHLTSREVAELGRQAASALAYAHQQNVLHRDIKPANLLVSEHLELWVTDFGVAKAIESEAVTRTGDVVGTLRYMAPEQIVGDTDVRSDIYSLGVTLYELLAGRPAVDDTSIREAIVARKPAPTPPPLRQLNASVPVDLDTILHAAMSADPAKRYQTAEAFEKDLEHFLEGEPITRRRMPFYERGYRWAKQNPAIASLSAISLMLLTSVALISSVGALQLRAANANERTLRLSAEGNAAAGLGALDDIFRHFSGGAGTLGMENDFSGAPAISSETADLLVELLPYYQDIESYNPIADGSALRDPTIKARAEIGDIQFNLGDYQQAIAAYRQLLTPPEGESAASLTTLERAKLRNQIGFAHRMDGEAAEALTEHEKAVELLMQEGDVESETLARERRFELARANYLMGIHILPGMGPSAMPPQDLLRSHRPRPLGPRGESGPRGENGPRGELPPRPRRSPRDDRGIGNPRPRPFAGGPPGPRGRSRAGGERPGARRGDHLEKLQTAISILRELLVDDPENLRYSLALARSLRQAEPRHLQPHQPSDAAVERESVAILERLHEKHPDNDTVLFELSDALADQDLFVADQEESTGSIANLTLAADNFSALCDEHPNVPKYVNAMVHTHFKLGMLREREAQRATQGQRRELERLASDSFRRAADRYGILVDKQPDAPGYRAWYALFLYHYGGNAQKSALLDQASESFRASAEQWKELIKRHPEEEISWFALPRVYASLGESLGARGKHDEAKAAFDNALMSEAYLDLGR
ncbi:MAG: protein kinase domain-containing protein [Rubripirellula sp.]